MVFRSASDGRTVRIPIVVGQTIFGLSELSPALAMNKVRDAHGGTGVAALESLLSVGILRCVETGDSPDPFRIWPWGKVYANAMHGYTPNAFVDDDDIPPGFLAIERCPPLFTQSMSAADGSVFSLPEAEHDDLQALLVRRRSNRSFDPTRAVSLTTVASILDASFRINGFYKMDGFPPLPFSAAPSPGALNSSNAFIISQRIETLQRGTYAYDPMEHKLTLLSPIPESSSFFVDLCGGQGWAESSSFVLIFQLDLYRLNWKYKIPTAINALFIEIGHRAQNVLLVACRDGLASCPVGLQGTGAFDLSVWRKTGISIGDPMLPLVYAIALGYPRDAGN